MILYSTISDEYDFDQPVETAPELEEDDWQALVSFFERSWFGRVWAFQEAAMAQEAIFLLGDWAMAWKEIEFVVDRFATHQNRRYPPIA
jgi:hypothetical protein